MYTPITKSIFSILFQALSPNTFSTEGLDGLFEHLEKHDTPGLGLEFDVSNVGGRYFEYNSLDEFNSHHCIPHQKRYADVRQIDTVIWHDSNSFIVEA